MPLAEKRAYLRKYPWSSYPACLSSRRSLLQVPDVLAYFGGHTPEGRREYRSFVQKGLTREMESPLERGKGHGIIGSAEFLDRIQGAFLADRPGSREVPAVRRIVGKVQPERILGAVATAFGVSRGDLRERGQRGIARPVLMELLYRYGGLNQREIGEFLGIDYSSVSVARKKLQTLLGKDGRLAGKIEGIKEKLIQES
jgi:hypothetical protein